MQIYKPMSLGFSSRAIEYRKRYGLCVTNYLHVPFDQGPAGRLWGEQSLWNFAAREMAVPLLDEGVAKLTPEFLVNGHAYPDPVQSAGCAVRVRLGSVEKTLLAFGDRWWDGDRPRAAAAAAERIGLDWDQAYGGADYALNPRGKGRTAAGGVRALPNLELPDSRVLTPQSEVVPAGFGALDSMHPQRLALRGTYDADYLQQHAPGFAPDLDWKHFNMAPRDQWFDAPLRGDEPYALDNLHPEQRHIEGQLPGLRVRTFVNYALEAGGRKLREVPMRLTTVWFFPHADRMVLVFHGMAECAEDDGADIVELLGAVERLGAPKPDAHYLDVLARRSDPKHGGLEALNDADLLPDGLDPRDPEAADAGQAFAMDGLQGEAQRRRAEMDMVLARETLVAQGKDPAAFDLRLPPPEPQRSMAELPAYLKARREEAEAQQWAAIGEMAGQLQRVLDLEEAGAIDMAKLVHRGPPGYNAEAHLTELDAQRATGLAFDRRVVAQKLAMREGAERLGYLQAAHLQPPAYPLEGEVARRGRALMEWMLARGLRSFPGIDLTGADLSSLDLRHVDFTDAWLESANLQGANVSGANFTRAVLAHGALQGVLAVGSNFTHANLGRARLAGAVLDQATLNGTVLMHCDLAQTQLRRADIANANLLETRWGPADWNGVVGPGLLFYKLDLKGLQASEANFAGANFIGCDLGGIDLRGARLASACFVDCQLPQARLAGAQLDGAVFTRDCLLPGIDLSHASLRTANFGEVDMQGATLVKACLDGANFGAARLAGCDARLASAEGALLRKAVFAQARLAGVNFKDAMLQHADLRSADLRNANLFGADLSRAKLDGDVRFDGALLERVRTWPRLSQEQQARHAAAHPL
ncbi:MAG: DUF2169 domain-containing protein [Variovorax sp.]